MQILITGVNGFIGKKLADHLSIKEFDVMGLDLTRGNFIQCDITNTKDVINVFQKYSPEVILHLAALSSTQTSLEDAIQTQQINFLGTVNLLEIALAHNSALKYFVLASSAEVYGGLLNRPYNETDLPTPCTPYAASKVAAESYVLMKGRQNGLKTCCIRFCNTFGRVDNKSFLVEYLFHSFLTNTPPVLKTPNSIREFMYIHDHLLVYETILKALPSGIINASTGESCSILEIANQIREITGTEMYAITESNLINTTILLDTKKLTKLGYRSSYSIRNGLLEFYSKLSLANREPNLF